MIAIFVIALILTLGIANFGEGSYSWVHEDTTTKNLTVKAGIRYIY